MEVSLTLQAIALIVESIALVGWTNAIASLVDVHSSFNSAHATTTFVDFETSFRRTWNALVVLVSSSSRWTYTISEMISNISFLDGAHGH